MVTQKEVIKKYLASLNGSWVKAFDLRGKQTPFGFTGHQADRRARELAQLGEIEHRVNGKFAEYRTKEIMPFPPAFNTKHETHQHTLL